MQSNPVHQPIIHRTNRKPIIPFAAFLAQVLKFDDFFHQVEEELGQRYYYKDERDGHVEQDEEENEEGDQTETLPQVGQTHSQTLEDEGEGIDRGDENVEDCDARDNHQEEE